MRAPLAKLKRRLLRRRISPVMYARYLARIPEHAWFDGEFYLSTYPDVAREVSAGRVAGPLEHFIRTGLAEGRLTLRDFDEAYYRTTYPLVDQAVRRGEFASAFQHYLLFGMANRFSRSGRVTTAPAPRVSPSAANGDLSAPAVRTDEVVIEFTTRCNLRCVYCAVSQPTYRGSDLDLSSFDSIVENLRARGTRVVSVNGHGETTIIEGWHLYCERLLDAGFALHLITNFARVLSDEEADTIARFHSVDVSCDTADPELFRQIRRGGDLRTLLFDMARVRTAARRLRLPGPLWKWSCVVNDRNWQGLAALVEFGLAQGVERFYLKNLVEYPAPPHGEPVHHIATLPTAEMRAARQAVLDAREAIVRGGAECELEAGLLEAVDAALAGESHQYATSIVELEATRFATQPAAGQTRDCLDPWSYAFIHADRSVRPCCMMDRTFGSLADAPLAEIVANDEFRALRDGLLTGELDPTCARCPSRALVAVDAFREKVRAHMADSSGRAAERPSDRAAN